MKAGIPAGSIPENVSVSPRAIEAGARMMREHEQRMLEHRMRGDDAGDCARELRGDVARHAAPAKAAFKRRASDTAG